MKMYLKCLSSPFELKPSALAWSTMEWQQVKEVPHSVIGYVMSAIILPRVQASQITCVCVCNGRACLSNIGAS